MEQQIPWLRLGPLALQESLLLSLAVTGLLLLLALAVRAGLQKTQPNIWQTAAEAGLQMMRNAVAEVIPADRVEQVLPFVGSLWLFVLVANLVGLIPGLASPTNDLSVTAALALVVFVAVHIFGLGAAGWRAYLGHYLKPSPLLLPFHLVSAISRTLALAVRLFGNIMSLEMAALLVLLVAGLLVPIPLLILHIIEALVQAYIFGMLALIYIGGALEAREDSETNPDLNASTKE